MHDFISSRRGEGSASVVGIIAIIVLVLIAGYFLFFRGADAPATEEGDNTINVTVPNPSDVMEDAAGTEPAAQ
jgi:uncharacterized protein YpmB